MMRLTAVITVVIAAVRGRVDQEAFREQQEIQGQWGRQVLESQVRQEQPAQREILEIREQPDRQVPAAMALTAHVFSR